MKPHHFLPLLAALALSACSTTRKGAGGGGADGDYVSGTPLGTPLPERQ